MKDLFDVLKEILKTGSKALLVTVVVAYFLSIFLEKRLEGIAGRVEEIAKTSLEVKRELRGEERSELVTFRVAVEEWENFLQTMIFDFSVQPPSRAQVDPFYQKEKELFLKVKIAAVRVGIYLRDAELEQQLMTAVTQLRKTYYPIINEPIPRLIDLQSRLLPIEQKLAAFERSGFLNMAYAPTIKDRDEHAALQTQLTEEVRLFSESLVKEYRGITEQMADLKAAVNQYIYRPIGETAIDGN